MLGLKGAIEAAIHSMDLYAPQGSGYMLNPNVPTVYNSSNLPSGPPTPTAGFDPEAQAGISGGFTAAKWPVSEFDAGLPGHITQHDILAAIGATLTARSDTFTVRAYGDVQNPATSTVESKAYCEAVVQRLPEYMDQTDTALATNGNATSPTLVNNINQTFGRRFKVISFRWLSPSDI